jgi:energy-coupling factor transporter ATP-binding protein EcfA2
MTNQSSVFKPGKGIAVIGAQGSGKSMLARSLARAFSPLFRELEFGAHFDRDMRTALQARPKVVIIDGTPNSAECATLKRMITNQTVRVLNQKNGQFEDHPAPKVIICTDNAEWAFDNTRRFTVIDAAKVVKQ